MAKYQIVRIERQPCPANPDAQHVIAVATGDPTLFSKVWRAAEVLAAINAGDVFFTDFESHVYCVTCRECGSQHVLLTRFDGPTNIGSPHG